MLQYVHEIQILTEKPSIGHPNRTLRSGLKSTIRVITL